MAKTLILFAHPRLENSRSNAALLKALPRHAELTLHDLYEHYPDFNINIAHEQSLLLQHDVVVWMHPFYWYSSPPLLKQWIDMVLEFGWAYGPVGTALSGKLVFNAITTGGSAEAYQPTGSNKFTISEFLAPFHQTARLCKMLYLPPFVVQGTHRLSDEALAEKAAEFGQLIQLLLDNDFLVEEMQSFTFLNQFVSPQKPHNP